MKNLGLLICLLSCSILASAQSGGDIFQFRAKIGFTGPSEKIIAQKFLDEDRKLLLISKETIQLWDIPNFKLLESRTHQIPKLENIDMYVRISPEGTKAIVLDGFSRRIIRKEKKVFATAWDLRTGKQIAVLERPIESIREAAWSEDGSTLVTYSDTFNDKRTEVSFWDGDTLALRSVIMMKGDLGFHKLSRDGMRFFASAQTSTTGIFDPLIAETHNRCLEYQRRENDPIVYLRRAKSVFVVCV